MADDFFSAGDDPAFPLRITVPGGLAPLRLDAALALLWPDLGLRARRRLWTWCRITVNGREQPPGRMVRAGDEIAVIPATPALPAASVAPATPAPALARGVFLVAADASYYALYKPEGLHSASIAGGNEASLESLLPRLWPQMAAPQGAPGCGTQPQEAHRKPLQEPHDEPPLEPPLLLLTRLDKGTSGLVLAARSHEAAGRFRELEEQGGVRKVYFTLVRGHVPGRLALRGALRTDNRIKSLVLDTDSPDAARCTLAVPLCRASFVAGQARPDADGPFTLLRVEIRRGARHQIRAHLAAAGYPLAGEDLYAEALLTGNNPGMLCLHHARLSFAGFSAECRPDWLRDVSESDYQSLFERGEV